MSSPGCPGIVTRPFFRMFVLTMTAQRFHLAPAVSLPRVYREIELGAEQLPILDRHSASTPLRHMLGLQLHQSIRPLPGE
jgi:hypothetical protein